MTANKPLIILDFDGVLFNSAKEAWAVCEKVALDHGGSYTSISLDEFMEFRRVLTDAWQFARLYSPKQKLHNFQDLDQVEPGDDDWLFADRFFAARQAMIAAPDWAKSMEPYDFYFDILPMMKALPNQFKILSTRNEDSIRRTLKYFDDPNIDVFGQEKIRQYGSKLNVAIAQGWTEADQPSLYIDDMHSHLAPFIGKVDKCIHASWGYDKPKASSLKPEQALSEIRAMLQIKT